MGNKKEKEGKIVLSHDITEQLRTVLKETTFIMKREIPRKKMKKNERRRQ
jgi:hypothetical protein